MFQQVMANSASMKVIFAKAVTIPAGAGGVMFPVTCPMTQECPPKKDVKSNYIIMMSNTGTTEYKSSVLESLNIEGFGVKKFEPDENKWTVAGGKDFGDIFTGLFAGDVTEIKVVPAASLATAETMIIAIIAM